MANEVVWKEGAFIKQNPCRYCVLADEYKGRHFPSLYLDKCLACEHRKRHNAYLKSQRKFEIGKPIKTIDELLEQEWIMWDDRLTHIEVIKSLQLRFVLKALKNNWFMKAIRKNTEVENE